MNTIIQNYRKKLEQKRGERNRILFEIREIKTVINDVLIEIEHTRNAKQIIQQIAKDTQKQMEVRISGLVSMALKAVFDDSYTLKVNFVIRREKTECDLKFEKYGIEFDPLIECSGGVVDVASFALRIALWSISPNHTRPIFILDEPFKNINDSSRITHKRLANLIQELSKKLQIQIIIVTLIPEIAEIADICYEVTNRKGKAYLYKVGDSL